MSIPSIIAHTPAWVWILLIFLLYRGIKALQPRETTRSRMLLLPVIFFVWALYGIATELHHLPLALAAFAITLLVGAAIGWSVVMRQEPAWLDRSTGLIHRPGSPVILILILIGFCLKYALSVYLAHHPSLAADSSYNALYGAISGVVDGIFWGITLFQLRAIGKSE